MSDTPTLEETQGRIRQHLATSNQETKVRDIAIAWEGYIAALPEWELISPNEHDILRAELPDTSSSAIYEIFVGVSANKSGAAEN